jgi:hypothetical protein
VLDPNSERYRELRGELIQAFQRAIVLGIRIDIQGMDVDTAANHVLDVLQEKGCLRKSHERQHPQSSREDIIFVLPTKVHA